MPRAFTETEKERIRASLMDEGEALFGRYGLKKTSVEDLTRAAGISKGAFYLFFPSKEELFFDILERFERSYRQDLLELAFQPGVPLRQSFKHMLVTAFTLLQTHPLFTSLRQGDLQALYAALPPERVEHHVRGDEAFAAEMIALAQQQAGGFRELDPQIAAGLIRALFFVSVHQDEFGEGVYAPTFDILLDLVLDKLIGPQPPG
jgi:AcrR family transcriptional regulator